MTAQTPEYLILNGNEVELTFCPPIPEGHPRIYTLREEEVPRTFYNTGCWRGYVGTWEIRDKRFYLVNIEGRYRLIGSEPLFADWFTGVLRIPRGETLLYVHMGFGSVSERELHIKVKSGVVTNSRLIDNRGRKFDKERQAIRNLPGWENSFPGDTDM